MDTFFVRKQVITGAVVFACLEITVLLFKALGHLSATDLQIISRSAFMPARAARR